MECSEVRLKLDEYMKNRLDCNTESRITAHLKKCMFCSEELALLRELNDILDTERSVFPAPDFTASIMGMIDNEKIVRRKAIFSRLPVINMGASLVLAGLLTIFVNTPFINNAIMSWRDSMHYGAAAINSSITTATSDVETYIRNILNTGGK